MDGAVRMRAKTDLSVGILVILVYMEVNYPIPQETPVPAPEPLYNKLLERGREGRIEGWRYFVGILLSFFVGYQILGAVPFCILIFRGLTNEYFTFGELLSDSSQMMNPEFLHVSKNVLLASILFIFVGAMAGLWFSLKYLHRKQFMSVVAGSTNKFDFKRYFFAFGIWCAVCVGQVVFSMQMNPEIYQNVFDPAPFFGGLVVLLIMLPIQTGWEEIFMRGYIMQMLGGWFKKSLWPWIITSVVFGLLHAFNTEVTSNGFWVMMPQYILPGVVFGAMALMDERLELPMGMHLAHNLVGVLAISSPDSSIQANSVLQIESISATYSDAIIGGVLQLLILLLFYRIYR